MSVNCDIIVIFPIYDQFGANRKPDSGRIVCKTYIFINNNLLIKIKFQVSNIIVTCFRQRDGVTLPLPYLKTNS